MKSFDTKNLIIVGLLAFCILLLAVFVGYLITENDAKKAEIARLQQQQPRQIGTGEIAEWILGEIIKSTRSTPETKPPADTYDNKAPLRQEQQERQERRNRQNEMLDSIGKN